MLAFIRRLIDTWRHPGEYPTQRQYRRYLSGINHATPAEPSRGVGPVIDGGAWPVAPDGTDAAARNEARYSAYVAAVADTYAETIPEKLARLRAAITAENISYGEIAELTSLAEHIDKDDVELLQWAGVPEFGPGREFQVTDLDDMTAAQVDQWNSAYSNDPILTCDICHKREWSGDLTDDWNGETGNHASCEQEKIDMEGVGTDPSMTGDELDGYNMTPHDEDYDPADDPRHDMGSGYRTL